MKAESIHQIIRNSLHHRLSPEFLTNGMTITQQGESGWDWISGMVLGLSMTKNISWNDALKRFIIPNLPMDYPIYVQKMIDYQLSLDEIFGKGKGKG